MEYLYAIVRENNGRLQKVLKPITSSNNYSTWDLCSYHDYSPSLSEQYCRSLSRISEEELNTFGGAKTKRMEAIDMERTARAIRETYDVVALSHRHGGWKSIEWSFNDDISFLVCSNFGYGSCSYLFTTFKYKNMTLAPYSFYVKYKNSTYATTVNHTYDYWVTYESWNKLMDDCLLFYNALVDGDACYIFTWLNGHLKEMVEGLERMLVSACYNFFDDPRDRSHASRFTQMTGDDLWVVKARKIAGSLEFVENIRSLPVSVNPGAYIERILNVCRKFVNPLEAKISEVTENINNHTVELHVLMDDNDYKLWLKFNEKFFYFQTENTLYSRRSAWSDETKLDAEKFKAHFEGMCAYAKGVETKEVRRRWDALHKRIDDIGAKQRLLSNEKQLCEELNKSLQTLEEALKANG